MGYSYGLIGEQLEISKSTLSGWLSSVPYIPNINTKENINFAREKSIATRSKKRMLLYSKIKTDALEEIGLISKRDLFMLGISLYIGEGSKTQKITRIINADPRVINLAIHWFCKICGLKMSNFSLAIHLYPDNDASESLRYWAQKTGVPLNQFGKTQIDRRENKTKIRNNKLAYGTAHLTVKSNGKKEFGVLLFKKIEFWMDVVLGSRD